MTQIIKVILKDGSSIHSNFFIDGMNDSRFQREILSHLDTWDIEDYAKDYLDLVDEDDVESDINDFSDEEITQEAKERNLLFSSETIIKDNVSDRFQQLLNIVNPLEIDELVTHLEVRYRLR